jgi:hypothetical protein
LVLLWARIRHYDFPCLFIIEGKKKKKFFFHVWIRFVYFFTKNLYHCQN